MTIPNTILAGIALGALLLIADIICRRYNIGPSIGDLFRKRGKRLPSEHGSQKPSSSPVSLTTKDKSEEDNEFGE